MGECWRLYSRVPRGCSVLSPAQGRDTVELGPGSQSLTCCTRAKDPRERKKGAKIGRRPRLRQRDQSLRDRESRQAWKSHKNNDGMTTVKHACGCWCAWSLGFLAALDPLFPIFQLLKATIIPQTITMTSQSEKLQLGPSRFCCNGKEITLQSSSFFSMQSSMTKLAVLLLVIYRKKTTRLNISLGFLQIF